MTHLNNVLMLSIIKIVIICIVFITVTFNGMGDNFKVGEKLTYDIFLGGFKVGYHTNIIYSIEQLNDAAMYRVDAKTKLTSIFNFFYKIDDLWRIYIDKKTLLPTRIEKEMVEGKIEEIYVYDVDQRNRTIVINKVGENNPPLFIIGGNNILDIISMIYYIRKNVPHYSKTGTIMHFDFLQNKELKSVSFEYRGKKWITIPKLKKKRAIPVYMFKQIGSYETEFYIGVDKLHLPLMLFIDSRYVPFKLDVEIILSEYLKESSGSFF